MLKQAHTSTKEIKSDHKQRMSCLPKKKKKVTMLVSC